MSLLSTRVNDYIIVLGSMHHVMYEWGGDRPLTPLARIAKFPSVLWSSLRWLPEIARFNCIIRC